MSGARSALDWEQQRRQIANMAVTMYAFLEAILLLVNAVAILNEERFLAKSKFNCLRVYIFVQYRIVNNRCGNTGIRKI